jgi:hypothetical protein
MSEHDDDAAAVAFCEAPEHRQLQGTGRKRAGQPRLLSSHVPIRFDAATMEVVKRLADDDGMTVSAWIRAVVGREVQQRLARITYTAHEQAPFSFEIVGGPPANVTSASGLPHKPAA